MTITCERYLLSPDRPPVLSWQGCGHSRHPLSLSLSRHGDIRTACSLTNASLGFAVLPPLLWGSCENHWIRNTGSPAALSFPSANTHGSVSLRAGPPSCGVVTPALWLRLGLAPCRRPESVLTGRWQRWWGTLVFPVVWMSLSVAFWDCWGFWWGCCRGSGVRRRRLPHWASIRSRQHWVSVEESTVGSPLLVERKDNKDRL